MNARGQSQRPTFPSSIFLGFALLRAYLFFLLASLQAFVCHVHLDSSAGTAERHAVRDLVWVTHFRLRTSSSISSSFDFARNCSLKGGFISCNLGSSAGIVVGSASDLSRTLRAWLITASTSSRFFGSLSSDSAYVERDRVVLAIRIVC